MAFVKNCDEKAWAVTQCYTFVRFLCDTLQKVNFIVVNMQFKSKHSFAFITAAMLLSGCASNGLDHRPKVSGEDIANYEVDLQSCQDLAANNKDLDKTTEGSIAGATTGALAGVLKDGGDILTNTVVGAIIGAAGGSYYSQKEQKTYIIKCMQDLGYNVVAED